MKLKSEKRPLADPMLLAIPGTAIGLVFIGVYMALIAPVDSSTLELAWFNPVILTFSALTSLIIAFLAFGRYQVLRDPFSYWAGVGFLTNAAGHVFYILSWPGLFPGRLSLLAKSTNTAAVLSFLVPVLLGISLLVGLFASTPGRYGLQKKWSLVTSAAVWLVIYTVLIGLLIGFERHLPVLVQPDGAYTPLLEWMGAGSVLVFLAGALLSTRRYQRTKDSLTGFMAILQIAVVFTLLTPIFGQARYDAWWYLGRVVFVSGYLAALFGLLFEDVRTLQRERASETRFQQLADAMPQLVWTARLDGIVDYYNQRYKEYNGIAPGADGRWEWSPVLHPDDVKPTVDAWQRSVRTGVNYQIEHRVKMTDGSYCWHLSRGFLGRDENGAPLKWYGTATNIHDLKQAQADLHKYSIELERSNRDLQQFAFVAAHDLQEPLRKIEAFSEAIFREENQNLTGSQLEYLERMRRSAHRMRSMIDGLLQLSRLMTGAIKFEAVDFNQVLEEIIADLDVKIRQTDATIEVSTLPKIEADPLQMRRLFQNLIGNALKFQPAGNKPHVRVSCEQTDPRWVQVTVQDNGIGFDETQGSLIFEPFKRLVGKSQGEYDGSGLGLAICRKIVDYHGGEITARSAPGQGATFVIRLPVKHNGRG